MSDDLRKLDKDADVTRMAPEALWYDDAILHYRYHKLKTQRQKYEGWTAEDMVNLHARIVRELERRGLPHFDRDDELDRDTKPFLKGRGPEDCLSEEPGPDSEADVEKSNYYGSKRRLAKYIVDKFPEDAKTIFDCMCGVSGVLIEAARRGYRVRANDLSIVPYWYSKGVFEGAPLSEADVEKLLGAPAHDGWLTTEWKGIYPRPRAIRRHLDGLAKLAREWKGPKGWTAKAAVSGLIQTLYSESGSGYSTRRYESLDKVHRALRHAAKEVSGFAAEVSGRGTVTNEDGQTMRFPRADLVYFDPPYYKRDKGAVKYFQKYRVENSLLLGKEWKGRDLKPEEIPPILERLCRTCRHIFVSTSSNEVVPYARELARHKRTMKRYRVSYSQMSGFGGRDVEQHQHLFVAKAGEVDLAAATSAAQAGKQADPFVRLPDEEKTLRYVVQAHHRGRSVHDDLRMELKPGGELIGWTLNTQIAGAVKEPVTTLAEARALEFEDYCKVNWETGEFAQRRKEGSEELVNASIVAERKSVEPAAWLSIEGVVRAGAVGATRTHPGVFRIVDNGTVEFLSQKPWFHEYLPHSDRRKGGLDYRIFFRQLRVADIKREEEEKALSPELLGEYLAHDPDVARADWDEGYWEFLKAKGEVILPAAETTFREEAAWLLIKPIDQTPYVLSDRAVEDGWVPPKGSSALPEAVRQKVPTQYRYWQMERESERRNMRDALVKAVEDGGMELPGVDLPAASRSSAAQAGKTLPIEDAASKERSPACSP